MEKNTGIISQQQFIESMQNLLQSTNNEELKKNEAILTQFTSQKDSLVVLCQTLAQENLPISIQQFISILLKKSVINNFLQLQQEQQQAVLGTLWDLFVKFQSQIKIITQIGSSISLIYQHQKKNLQTSPEVQSFLKDNLTFNDKNKYIAAVILLSCIVENCDKYFNFSQVSDIINRVLVVFSEDYNESFNDIYVNSQKALCNFLKYYSESEEESENDLKELLNSIFTISCNLLKNNDFMMEQEKEYEPILINFLDEIQQNLDIANPKFNQESLNSIFQFVTNQDILLNPDINDNIKSSLIETLGFLNMSYPQFLNRKTSEVNLNKTLEILTKMILIEEKNYQERIKQNPQLKLYEFTQDKLINLIFQALEAILRNQKHKAIYEKITQMKNLFYEQNAPRMILILLSSTCQQFSLFYAKEIEYLIRNFIFPSLDSQQEDLILNGLRALLYFQEFLIPDILEYHKEILKHVLKFLQFAKDFTNKDEYEQKVIINILEQNMYLIEIILENLEDNELDQYGQELMENIVYILQNANQNQRMKKISLQALSAVFVSCPSDILFKNMQQIIQILIPYLNDEFLIGVTLICFSRLCFYGLKDNHQKQQIYESYFLDIYNKCKQILNSTNNIIDYDLYEGALSFFYQTTYLFEQQSSFIIDQQIVVKWIEFVEDAKPQINFNENLEDDEDINLEEQICQKLVQKLPFVYMISAALNLIGACLRYMPDKILVNEQSYTKIKNMLFSKLLSENQDERHQAYIGIYLMVQGVYLSTKKNISLDFAEATEIMLNNELSDINLQRNLEQFVKYSQECSEFPEGNSLYENPQFLQKIGQTFAEFLKQQYEKDINPEIYIEISETISKLSKNCKTQNFFEFLKIVYPAMVYPLLNQLDVDFMIFEEGFGFLAEIIFNQPDSLQIFIQMQNSQNEFINFVQTSLEISDEHVQRNGVYLIGEIFDKMSPPFLSEQSQIESLIKKIEQIYLNSSFLALKENCIATFFKLYFNDKYKEISKNIFTEDNLLSVMKQVLPLKEDKQECLIFLKAILYFYQQENLKKLLLEPKILFFMIESIINNKDIQKNQQIMQSIKLMFQKIENDEQFSNTIQSLDTDSRNELRNILQNNQLIQFNLFFWQIIIILIFFQNRMQLILL